MRKTENLTDLLLGLLMWLGHTVHLMEPLLEILA